MKSLSNLPKVTPRASKWQSWDMNPGAWVRVLEPCVMICENTPKVKSGMLTDVASTHEYADIKEEAYCGLQSKSTHLSQT